MHIMIRRARPALLIVSLCLLPMVASAQPKGKAPASGAKVDLNTASQADLEALPSVGPATAKKIIAGRPYATVADLSKAGVPAKTIQTITPLVTVGAAPSGAAPAAAPAPKATPPPPAPSPAPAATRSAPAASVATPAGPPPAKGMVWVNTATKVYHREGDRYYGKTKEGKYMTEADAIAAGYREAKTGAAKKK